MTDQLFDRFIERLLSTLDQWHNDGAGPQMEAILPIFEQQAQAAVAAVVEKAAQIAQDENGHDPECPWNYSPETNHVENCTCEAKELADKVRSIAPQSAQDALREAKVEAVSKALSKLWQLLCTRTNSITELNWQATLKLAMDKVKEGRDEQRTTAT